MKVLARLALMLAFAIPLYAQTHAFPALDTTNAWTGNETPAGKETFDSLSIAGPRPYIDVTAAPHGAKGDSATDDTVAIQTAITAACATTIGQPMHPDVFFPPGDYVVSQPQTPSTSPVFTASCSLRFIGGGGKTPQFSTRPVATISAAPGASPNGAAVFEVTSSDVEFENLGVDGQNEAISAVNVSNIELDNVSLRVLVTGGTDNTPLRLSSVLWFWMNGGVLGFNNANPNTFKSLYDATFVGESGTGGNPVVYLIHFKDVTGFGGGFNYDQRGPSLGQNASNITFENVSIEDSANSFFTVTSSGGVGLLSGMNAISFDNARIEDALNSTTQGVLNFNAANVLISGISVRHSYAPGPAILLTAGFVDSYFVLGCDSFCSTGAMNASGTQPGGGWSQTDNGFDASTSTTQSQRLETGFGDGLEGLPLRVGAAGNAFVSLGVDPALGFLFGDGLTYGFNSNIYSPARNELDVGFTASNPPTNLAGSPAAGGSLAAATYYFALFPTTASCPGGGAPTVLNTGVVVSGANDAVALTWTPSLAGMTTISGYCLVPSTSPISVGSSGSIFISGASTASFTYTGQSTAAGTMPYWNTMVSAHRFTPNALGINTTSPAYDLDVAHAGATNSGIRATNYSTATNCTSSGSPAVCGSAAAGAVTIAAAASTVVVDTTAVTANSDISLTFNSALGMRLSVACNTTAQQPTVSAISAGVSFTISVPSNFARNPGCITYSLTN